MYLVEHVALPPREATPVGEDNKRQPLVVDVLDRLSGLVGAVGEPDSTGLSFRGFERRKQVARILVRSKRQGFSTKAASLWRGGGRGFLETGWCVSCAERYHTSTQRYACALCGGHEGWSVRYAACY